MHRNIGLAILVVFALVSCTDTETVEREEFGMTEKYQVSKKTGLKQGVFEKFNSNGSLFEKAHYEKDTLQGKRLIYHPSGNQEIEEYYVDGVLDGPFKTWYEDSALELEGQYADGVMTGKWKRYYKNGGVMEEVTFADNLENGPFVEYHENGNLKAEGHYRNGDREQGLLKLYDENGELYKTMECDDGICRTTWTRPGYEEEGND
jgi:antitoxin component YwqK of YwqJK toxin-antitoxin module